MVARSEPQWGHFHSLHRIHRVRHSFHCGNAVLILVSSRLPLVVAVDPTSWCHRSCCSSKIGPRKDQSVRTNQEVAAFQFLSVVVVVVAAAAAAKGWPRTHSAAAANFRIPVAVHIHRNALATTTTQHRSSRRHYLRH